MLGPLPLVLASAVLHAAWNAILKREREPQLAVVPVSAVGAAVGAVGAFAGPGFSFHSAKALGFALLAGVFEGTYFLTLGRALGAAPLSTVYTVSRGGALILVWPISIVLFGEAVHPWSIAGAALVALGLAATASGPKTGAASTRGIVFASLAGASIAGYHVSYKTALAAGAPPPATLAISMALGVVLNVALLDAAARARLSSLVRARPLPLGLAGLLTGVSFLLFLMALARGGAGAMLTLRNTSVVFATLFALFIGERPSRAQWGGAVLVVLGAAAIGR